MNSLPDFETVVPKEFHVGIVKLCQKIGTGTSPIFVDVAPEADSKPNDCFQNVQRKKEKDGGELQHGWIIWELPGILIEGEFHCVWKSPQGQLLCISTREDNERSLAFLPDHARQFAGLPTANIGLSWPKNLSVDRFLEKEASFQRFKNRHTNPHTGALQCPQKDINYHLREIEFARSKIKISGAAINER